MATIKKQMTTTVVHLKRKAGQVVQDCDIYIGRACNMGGWQLPQSKWRNPYSVKQYGDQALPMYEAYLRSNPALLADLPELVGKRLGCWCAPNPCHGHILLKLLREYGYLPPSLVLKIVRPSF